MALSKYRKIYRKIDNSIWQSSHLETFCLSKLGKRRVAILKTSMISGFRFVCLFVSFYFKSYGKATDNRAGDHLRYVPYPTRIVLGHLRETLRKSSSYRVRVCWPRSRRIPTYASKFYFRPLFQVSFGRVRDELAKQVRMVILRAIVLKHHHHHHPPPPIEARRWYNNATNI